MTNELITRRAEAAAPKTSRGSAVAAVVVNGMLLYVAENLLRWDLVDFLTDDYTQVLPAIRLSLWASIAANLARLVYRAPWFARATDALSTAVGLYAAVRLYQVFPFDFAEGGLPWELLVRAVLIIAIVGSIVTLIAAPFRLMNSLEHRLRSGE